MQRAIELDRTVDTITGRKTGQFHRTEKRFHNIDGRLYITGTLGCRDWYANPVATPRCTFHLKHGARGYLNARATLFRDRVYLGIPSARPSRKSDGTATRKLG